MIYRTGGSGMFEQIMVRFGSGIACKGEQDAGGREGLMCVRMNE